MIRVYYGDDRTRAVNEAKKWLGADYEVLDGADISVRDLPSILMGGSLFETERRILIRDLTENKEVSEKIAEYAKTPHKVTILEQKVAKNSFFYKGLSKVVEFREFKLMETSFYRTVLNIYNTAKRDGVKAVSEIEKIKMNEDPMGFLGMMVTIALSEFEKNQGRKEKRALKELSKLDIEIKSTPFSPWTLIESFLLRVSSWF